MTMSNELSAMVERMATEAGWRARVTIGPAIASSGVLVPTSPEQLQRFAQLVAEECSGIVESADPVSAAAVRARFGIKGE
jgi:hypothetical protein